jgi:hypothetical protein
MLVVPDAGKKVTSDRPQVYQAKTIVQHDKTRLLHHKIITT